MMHDARAPWSKYDRSRERKSLHLTRRPSHLTISIAFLAPITVHFLLAGRTWEISFPALAGGPIGRSSDSPRNSCHLRDLLGPRQCEGRSWNPRSPAQDDPMSSVSYPPVPPQAPYTSCYCEENVYLLLASFLEIPDLRESWNPTVVFISNHSKTASNPFSAWLAITIHLAPPVPSADAARTPHYPPRLPFGASEHLVRKGSHSCGTITSFSSSGLSFPVRMTAKVSAPIASSTTWTQPSIFPLMHKVAICFADCLPAMQTPGLRTSSHPVVSSRWKLINVSRSTPRIPVTDYLKQTFPYMSYPSGLDVEYHR